MTFQNEILNALKEVLEKDPKNPFLWVHYGDLLANVSKNQEALNAYRISIELVEDKKIIYKKMIPLLRKTNQLAEVLIRAENLLEEDDDMELSVELIKIFKAYGDEDSAVKLYQKIKKYGTEYTDSELEKYTPETTSTESFRKETNKIISTVDTTEVEDFENMFDWSDLHTTFADVVGLETVKQQINLRIIAPYKNPKIYNAFHMSGGGGILLYGPPGCGKTFIARATSGECKAHFVSVSIHEIIDKYWGESEKLIHELFREARQKSPTVIFFDEFDALGTSRGKSGSQFWKSLVNQLLQEMDGIVGKTKDVMIFAATNMPWHIDSAFKRPGRFDRTIFVPPPDEKARINILQRCIKVLPGGDKICIKKLAKKTILMTCADLKALCERSAERALTESLETEKLHAVTLGDFEREMKKLPSSALDWLSSARNYAKYSNESGQYDDLKEFLKEHKRW